MSARDVQTRRNLLQQILTVPFASRFALGGVARPNIGFTILGGPSCLQAESAAGFRLLLNRSCLNEGPITRADLVVVTAARDPSRDRLRELYDRAVSGAWVIWETAPDFCEPHRAGKTSELLSEIFDIRTGLPFSGTSLYIQFHWPVMAMIRTFGPITPVDCGCEESIAEYEGRPIGARKCIGCGGVLFLGGLLGPHLLAQDPQAHELANRIMRPQIFRNNLRRYIQNSSNQ